jgi:hypothetical protein
MDTIRSVITFNQRNATTVSDVDRIVNMICDEQPMHSLARCGVLWDGETVTLTITMNAHYMDEFISMMKILTGNTPGVNGILHYMGVALTERRQRGDDNGN